MQGRAGEPWDRRLLGIETIIEWHRRMIEIAREEGIPAMQNVPLARALNEDGDIDRYIPSELIGPVAEVLRWMQ